MFAIGSCLDSGHWGAECGASWTGAKTECWAGTASLETQPKGCKGLCERRSVVGEPSAERGAVLGAVTRFLEVRVAPFVFW